MQTKTQAAVFLDPNSLTLWEKNPRKNSGAIEPLARSLVRFGFGNPVLARERDKRVIAGHSRLAAFHWCSTHVLVPAVGWRLRLPDDGPFVMADVPNGTVPVRLLNLSETEATALALADNRLGELASWDDEQLAGVLAELVETTSLEGLGWTDDDLRELESVVPDIEDVPMAPAEQLPPTRQAADGMVDFSVPMTPADRSDLFRWIAEAKRRELVETTSQAVLAVFRKYAETV